MSLVHKVKNEVTTFGDVAADLHGMVCKEGMHSNRIDVVFDTYQTIYIKKNVERTQIGEEGLQLHNISSTQLIRLEIISQASK